VAFYGGFLMLFVGATIVALGFDYKSPYIKRCIAVNNPISSCTDPYAAQTHVKSGPIDLLVWRHGSSPQQLKMIFLQNNRTWTVYGNPSEQVWPANDVPLEMQLAIPQDVRPGQCALKYEGQLNLEFVLDSRDVDWKEESYSILTFFLALMIICGSIMIGMVMSELLHPSAHYFEKLA
jgi:hypothetical protein